MVGVSVSVTVKVTLVFPFEQNRDDIVLYLPTVPRKGEEIVVWEGGQFSVREVRWSVRPVQDEWAAMAVVILERVIR